MGKKAFSRAQPGPRRAGDALNITDRELFERLGWFTQVRWVFGLFCMMALLISWYLLGVRFRNNAGELTLTPAVSVIVIIFLYNALFTFLVHVVKSRRRINRRVIVTMALLQIGADLAAISALVHNTGGVENFFIVLVLVPMVIAAELLPQTLAYATAGAAAICINILAWLEQTGVVPHVRVELVGATGVTRPLELYANDLYVLHVTTALTFAVFGLVFVATTIAARLRKREAELEDAYRQLHRTDETKSFFMRKASHEMRAPLSAIHSMLDAVALSTGGLAPQSQHMLERVRNRTQGLMALVRDLHRYSMLRSTEGLVQAEEVGLGEVAMNTAELFREKARVGGITLSCKSVDSPVIGDRELLVEMVTNLVANAVQYTPEGGAVDVTLTHEGPDVILEVADTGIGISEKAREHVFDEFYR